MFETAELGHQVDKATYEREAAEVRAALLEAQRELALADVSVVVIVTGVGGAGKSETVNLLLEWLDARGIQTHAMRKPSAEERRRPPLWRFWVDLPPRGRMAIFFGAWYAQPILDRRLRADRPVRTRPVARPDRRARSRCSTARASWSSSSGCTCRRRPRRSRSSELEADPRQRWRIFKRDWKLFKPVRRLPERRRARPEAHRAPATPPGTSSRGPTGNTAT